MTPVQPEILRTSVKSPVTSDHSRSARLLARVRRARGQVTVEWLLVAGLLTAIAVFIMGIIPATLIKVVQRIAMSLRTIAP
jgi:hypothetical protein